MATWDPRANELFLRAIEAPDSEARRALLDASCAGDADLRRRVEALLHAHEAAGTFLEASPAAPTVAGGPPFESAHGGLGSTLEIVPARGQSRPIAEGPGTVIGPYRLLQKIGEGGMGTVFLAEQEKPVRRRVALKVIKPGMDTEAVVARFEAERQALALMDHPNIARVLDAGATATGRPYFVMELVNGLPITGYCDEARLPPKGRLELFAAVCSAIQHAHQKGIIHRDIKPSNVLVTVVDGLPVPKVIDFGVAKAVDQRLTERPLFTQFGAIVGTLEYMSPEQAEQSGTDIDTRTDIYALGVLLYELLTGTTPLEQSRTREVAFTEVLRRIKEEEPPRPSTRLSGSAETLTSIAAARAVEPTRLARLVRGDLDWIVMKALEKERARRYDSAAGLGRDIRRHLDGDPVEACPPSRWYRLRKFAGKNRAVLARAGAFVTMLVIATAVSATLAVVADRARRRAEGAAESERRTSELLASILGDLDPNGHSLYTGRSVREILRNRLRRTASNLHTLGVEDPIAVARLQFLLGDSLLRLDDPDGAIEMLRPAIRAQSDHLGQDHPIRSPPGTASPTPIWPPSGRPRRSGWVRRTSGWPRGRLASTTASSSPVGITWPRPTWPTARPPRRSRC
jgi:serine/threonine protein kinase